MGKMKDALEDFIVLPECDMPMFGEWVQYPIGYKRGRCGLFQHSHQ